MTDTSPSTRADTPHVNGRAAKGLQVERIFTTPGVHPYDDVTWERRDVVQTNWKTGETIFEQRGVEFPDFWSANASTIVTTKYFRGAPGTEAREWSLRQLLDRVVLTYTKAGKDHGYFASDEDAQIFEHELTYALLHQVFSFNSPVWFNVGTSSPQAVSACFILSVDDTMDSILDWYKEEGLIFKGGSGSGVNLSRIRSSKELLSSGGTASGPVSFMRGADASAGTIKSGGATRRAAKMVVLDVDHPDVEEFIETKASEERKIRALRDAGFDMDLGGKDITSVQYQNANNSVRVSDEFMRAVEQGGSFGLRARATGEVIETVDAKALFEKMAHAAWDCADPGIQYDDTINDWHTNPETGRITASNPCSEYLSLDDSSCNLASLNLLKFLRPDDTFDARTFARVVELVITAMDISICFADFPTEKIGETTRAYRQLGIGYANLGALLMATGKGYDSDGGRALAAAITSLMTGTAYKRSAELAGVVGPYEGYARNAAGHRRVMRKHAAANDAVRTVHPIDRDVHGLATQAWEECLRTGEKNGWRNAQASVLAPTGCLTADTLVTTSRGLLRLSELGDVWGERWQELDLTVSTDEGPRDAINFFVNGEEPTRRILTRGGYRVQGTLAHRVKVVDPETGAWVWRRLADVRVGDLLPLQLGTLVGEPQRVRLPALGAPAASSGERAFVPEVLDAELAELAGYAAGGGDASGDGLRLRVGEADDDVVARLRVLGKGLFGLEAEVTRGPGQLELLLPSAALARWWQTAGFAGDYPSVDVAGKAWTPRVPTAVRATNDPAIYAAYLRGLFEAAGSVVDGAPRLSTSSETLADDLRTMLLALGLRSSTRAEGAGFEVRAHRLDHGPDFDEAVGFIGERAARRALDSRTTGDATDVIPLSEQVWRELAAVGDEPGRVVRQAVDEGGDVTRALAVRLYAATGDARLTHALQYVYEPVAENVDGGVQPTYDLSVPENVTYVANGFVSHNTIGFMMDCDTTGVEPDFSLVKFKKLVGGGSMQIVNQTIPRALRKLGYTEETVEAIVEYIAEHGHVIDAPGLRPEHYEVFDCAMGERAIRPMGHVRMMAAVQPFLSGAISKCVVGDTLITTEDGLVRIGSLHEGEEPDTFRQQTLAVASLGGTKKTDGFYYGGVRPVREITLRSGHRVTGTPNHRVLVATPEGPDWRHLSEVSEGDYVALQYGAEMWSALPARFDDFRPSPRYGSQKDVRIPTEMSEELAFLLGAYASEGHTTRSTWTVVITNSCDEVLERVRACWQAVFGVEACIARQKDKCPAVLVASKEIVEFLTHLGCGGRASDKRIPDAVLRSPREMVLAFLQGLALDAYVHVPSTGNGHTKWGICLDSRRLLDDLQAVLTNLGVLHGRVRKFNPKYGKHYDEVYASGEQARTLSMLVPFAERDKAANARHLVTMSFGPSSSDVVPCITGRQLYEAIPLGPGWGKGLSVRSEFTYLLDPRTQRVSRRTLEKVAAVPGVQLPQWVYDVIWDRLHFAPVVGVEDAGEREVYDLSVPETHAFVGNGVVNHNTVNVPETATVEEIEDVYFQGWKLGLKALAIYRDNCKVGQPLSDGKAKKADAEASAGVAPVVEYRPVRKRLPKSRPSVTTSFAVGGAEGYMTASSYPDDGLGEVFLKMSKQGSTLAGMMDAFSVAVSIGLQYGVPLETFVSKFLNMRFEPAGLTDDQDVRMAQSIMDYIFRRLALDYLPFETRGAYGVYSAEERARQLETGSYEAAGSGEDGLEEELETFAQTAPTEAPAKPSPAVQPAPAEVHSSAELFEAQQGRTADAPLCFSCGTKMRPAGSCYVCEGCGSTSGCS